MPQVPRPAQHRRRRWIIAALVIVVVVIASLRTFAVFYTDALWFSSVSLHSVWLKLFEIKTGLMVVFAVIFAVLLLASLVVAERLAPKGPSLDAEDEFVKRYREVIGPYSRWLRAGVVVVLSLIVGSQALGQWQNWILFRNGVSFPNSDPQFHRNIGYFVFTLPFEQFLVHWTLVALFVVLVVTVLSHYLNGGIRMQGSRPRVRPAVKALEGWRSCHGLRGRQLVTPPVCMPNNDWMGPSPVEGGSTLPCSGRIREDASPMRPR